MRRRGEHSAKDEKRIDRLQEVATERLGRGAAVLVQRFHGAHRAVVFDKKGEVVLSTESASKSLALEDAIKECETRQKGREDDE